MKCLLWKLFDRFPDKNTLSTEKNIEETKPRMTTSTTAKLGITS